METFSLSIGDFSSLRGLYRDFTGTLLYGDFFSLYDSLWRLFLFTGTLRGLYGDSSLWRLFLSLYGDFSSFLSCGQVRRQERRRERREERREVNG